MLFTSIEQTLRIAARSEDSRMRQQAINHLRQLHLNGSSFLAELLRFILMGDREIHILSYTYLLNHWILGTQRLALDLITALQKTYLSLKEKEIQQVTFNYQDSNFRVQNLIRLGVAFLIKPQHLMATKDFLKKIGLQAFQDRSIRLRQFHTKILQGMNESIDNTIRCIIGGELGSLLSQVLISLWQRSQQQMLFVVEASYYLVFLDAKLFHSMIQLIGRIHGQHPLLWKIIARIKVALLENRFNPPLQLSFMTYRRIKLLIGSINISNIKSYSRDRQLYWLIAQRLRNVVDIISGVLGSIYRSNLNEQDLIQINENIMNRNQYQLLVGCLIEISYQFQNDDEDQQIDSLKKSITQLMQQLNDRMQQEDLYYFYEKIRSNIDSNNVLKIMTFLCGASRQVLQLFQCQNVIKRMVNYEFQIPLSGSFMYYLFLGRYLKMNIYYIDQVLLLDIYEFILRHVDLQETALNESSQERASCHHLLKISQLMLIAAESVNIPWTRFFENYLPIVIKKIFYYLANSFLGVPDAARENLLQAMISIVSKKIAPLNTSITASLLDIYSDCFLQKKEFNLKTHRITCKVQQQLLQILTKSITEQSVLDPLMRTKLIFVMNCVPQMDEVIIKELALLIFTFMKIYNNRLLSKNVQELQGQTKQSFQLPFGQLGTFLLSSLKVQNFQQCISLLSNKYEQMFVNRVKQLLENYHSAVLLLLQLSLYPSYYSFVDFMMIQMIKHLQKFYQTCVKLSKAVCSHPAEVKLAFLELVKIKQLAQCLLQAMHLNPLWRNNKFTSQNKLSISSSQSFQYCKQNINNLFSFLVTEMMNQVSLSQTKITGDTWSKRYGLLLYQSTAKMVIDKWLITYQNF